MGSRMALTVLILGVLGVWRVTHLLHAEDGPWNVFARFRRWLGGGVFGQAFACFYCLSLWIAAPFALGLGGSWPDRALLWPALSGGAILLHRATSPPDPGLSAIYFEDEETNDVLRRQPSDELPDEGREPGL
jgi:hypothetical protein